jgi:hypothetical protein
MTAAAPSPSEGRRPLGEVLVERGIVTPEQLTIALEQQRTTGQQLGEIIVGFGFAPGPIVAQALATQHGGLIKTEYGFAMGWSSDDAPKRVAAAVATPIAASELAERDRMIAELRAWAESAQSAIAARDDAIARLRTELAELAEQERAPEPTAHEGAHEEALEALRAELAAESEAHGSTRAQLQEQAAALAARDETLAQLRTEIAELAEREPTPEPAAHEEALEALRAELAAESEAHGSTRAQLQEQAAALAARDETLAQLRAELADAGHEEALEAIRAELAAKLEEHAAEIARIEAARTGLSDAATAREAELAGAKEGLTKAEYELTSARSTNDELERRLQNARSRAETLARRVAEQDEELEALRAPAPVPAPTASGPSRWASAPMHYVLRRGAGAYELVEHDGPPPRVGDTVDGLRVARVAPAGPGFEVPCAYLAD